MKEISFWWGTDWTTSFERNVAESSVDVIDAGFWKMKEARWLALFAALKTERAIRCQKFQLTTQSYAESLPKFFMIFIEDDRHIFFAIERCCCLCSMLCRAALSSSINNSLAKFPKPERNNIAMVHMKDEKIRHLISCCERWYNLSKLEILCRSSKWDRSSKRYVIWWENYKT